MILTKDSPFGQYQITAYEDGKVTINQVDYSNSLLLSVDKLKAHWPVNSIQELTPEHIETIIALKPAIVLLGTGNTLIRPNPEQLKPLYDQKIAVECMSTRAACTTFSALAAESRDVVAALIID